MTEVFVSYSRTDRRVALPIVVAIGEAGLQVRRSAMSYAGDPLAEQIERELGEAQCLVVSWSEAAAQSLWVQQEVRYAIRAWSSDRLVLATLDDTPLPVGLRARPIMNRRNSDPYLVIPAQAGIQGSEFDRLPWTPAFAGVTNRLLIHRISFRVAL
jgi:hypothetical protein